MSEATSDPADGAEGNNGLTGKWRGLKPMPPFLWATHRPVERAVKAGGATGLAVYVGLCACESKSPVRFKNAFRASAQNISHECGLSSRTVERMLPLLVRAGLISMVSGRSVRGAVYEANTFRILELPGVREGFDQSDTQSERSDFETRFDGGHKRISYPKGVKKRLSARSAAGEASPPTAAGEVKKKRACRWEVEQ